MANENPDDQFDKASSRLFGELWLDNNGAAHFVCHIEGTDFLAAQVGIEKFIALLQQQIVNRHQCPFYRAKSQ